MGLRSTDIEERIAGALLALRLLFPAGLVERVVAAYESPSRHYHNLGHIRACLAAADEFDRNDPLITLALCYHDVVYDTHAMDNERLSAEWAVRDLRIAGAADADCDRITRLIMATTHRAVPVADDEKIVTDADLSILGAMPDEYDGYVRAVRQEYGWMSNADFRAGRTAFLNSMLVRPFIFSTDRMRDRLEEKARSNMKREQRAFA